MDSVGGERGLVQRSKRPSGAAPCESVYPATDALQDRGLGGTGRMLGHGHTPSAGREPVAHCTGSAFHCSVSGARIVRMGSHSHGRRSSVPCAVLLGAHARIAEAAVATVRHAGIRRRGADERRSREQPPSRRSPPYVARRRAKPRACSQGLPDDDPRQGAPRGAPWRTVSAAGAGRTRRDSNPRYAINVHTLSRRAP